MRIFLINNFELNSFFILSSPIIKRCYNVIPTTGLSLLTINNLARDVHNLFSKYRVGICFKYRRLQTNITKGFLRRKKLVDGAPGLSGTLDCARTENVHLRLVPSDLKLVPQGFKA